MNIFVAIVVVWAVVIPGAVLAISWLAPDRPEASRAQTNESERAGRLPTTPPRRARRTLRLSRIPARRVCPEFMTYARRRRTSA